jgi:hypothetical protein
MAKKSKVQKVPAQELSDDQLEAVAGGTGAGDAPAPLEDDSEAAARKKAQGMSPLMQAAAKGKHFPKVILHG